MTDGRPAGGRGLPALPPLRRSAATSGAAAWSGALPRLPPLPDPRRQNPAQTDHPRPILLNEGDTADWGAFGPGRWAGAPGETMGTCARCGEVRRAWDLKLVIRPFGRGEEWRCEGGC